MTLLTREIWGTGICFLFFYYCYLCYYSSSYYYYWWGGGLPSDIVTSFFADGSGKTKHLVYHSFMFLLYFLSVISLLYLIFFYSKILYLPARKGSQEEKGMVAEDDTSCLLFWCVAAQVLLLLGVRMRLFYSTWFLHSKRLNSDYQVWSYKKKSRTRL